tara:strand:+ start:370 stop:798 length:429 start_codon:yes stop_codon:yes gene_type:complete
MIKKNKGGRPKIELTDLPKGWEEIIINLSKKGASLVELAVSLDICRDTLYALIEREPKFSDTIKRCKGYCEAWWLSKGRTELENQAFSYTGWYMNMKNRFNWADKKEIKEEKKIISEIDYSELDAGTIKNIIEQLRPNKTKG